MERRWFKIGAGAAASVVTVSALFYFLIMQYGFVIIDQTGNIACAGDYSDPCISQFTVRNPTKYNIDIYSSDQVKLDFSPDVSDYALFVKDGRCSANGACRCELKDGTKIGYDGWRCLDFTNKTKPREDTKYVYRFSSYSSTLMMLVGFKEDKKETVKWTISAEGSNNSAELDPFWYGLEDINFTNNVSSIDAELGSILNLSMNLSGVSYVEVDIDHPAYGINYTQGSPNANFLFNISYFRRTDFNGSSFVDLVFSDNETQYISPTALYNTGGTINISYFRDRDISTAYYQNDSFNQITTSSWEINFTNTGITSENVLSGLKLYMNVSGGKIYPDSTYCDAGNGGDGSWCYWDWDLGIWNSTNYTFSSTTITPWSSDIPLSAVNTTSGEVRIRSGGYFPDALTHIYWNETYLQYVKNTSGQNKFYVEAHKYDDLVNFSLNLTSNENIQNVKLMLNGTIVYSIPLVTPTSTATLSDFNGSDLVNANLSNEDFTASTTQEGFIYILKDANVSSAKFNVTGNPVTDWDMIGRTQGTTSVGYSIHDQSITIPYDVDLEDLTIYTSRFSCTLPCTYNVTVGTSQGASDISTCNGLQHSTSLSDSDNCTLSGSVSKGDVIWFRFMPDSPGGTGLGELATTNWHAGGSAWWNGAEHSGNDFVFQLWFDGTYYPYESRIDVGTIDTAEWNESSELTGTEVSSDFNSSLNTLLQNCIADSFGFCSIPMYFTSSGKSSVNISSLDVSFENNYNPIYIPLSNIQSILDDSSSDKLFLEFTLNTSTSGATGARVQDLRDDYSGGNSSVTITVRQEPTSECYQETATTSTGCGGLATGSYSTPDGWLYVNYTKPSTAIGAIWQVRHGNSSDTTYNITIPDDCFDNSDNLALGIYSNSFISPGSLSQPYCLSDSGWTPIGEYRSDNAFPSRTSASASLTYDGDYSTYASGLLWGTDLVGSDASSRIYEEGVIWELGAEETLNVNFWYSKANYTFPQFVNYLEFIPKTPTAKNVTPHGQTPSKPILNATTYNYGGLADYSVHINETYSCVDLYLSTNGSKPSSSLWDGLIGYWPFDVDTKDKSGFGPDGVIGGQVALNRSSIISGGAYFFGDKHYNGTANIGSQGYIYYPSTQAYEFTSGDDMSFSLWIYQTSTTIITNNMALFGIGSYSESTGMGVNANDQLLFGIRNASNNIVEVTSSNGAIQNNQWYFVVGTYKSSTGNISLYLNGTIIDSDLGANNSFNLSGKTFDIGRTTYGGNFQTWNGTIDEVRIYNRTLDSSEIEELYQRGSLGYHDIKLQPNWQTFLWNASHLDNQNIWMWADYSCNFTSWKLWEPDISLRGCCVDCACSEDV